MSGDLLQANILSITVTCPTMGDTAHISFYDHVLINWEQRTIQYYCTKCRHNHVCLYRDRHGTTGPPIVPIREKVTEPKKSKHVPPPWEQ